MEKDRGKGSRLVEESFVAHGEPHGSSMLPRGYSHDVDDECFAVGMSRRRLGSWRVLLVSD